MEGQLHHLNLSIVSVNLAKDSRFDELIESVKERVKDDDEGDLICIPVNEFNDLVEDCGFYEYEMRALRGRLKDEGYIHTKGNRFAIPVRIKKDKVSRMVAFKKDKLGVAVPVSKKGKQSKKSGADE